MGTAVIPAPDTPLSSPSEPSPTERNGSAAASSRPVAVARKDAAPVECVGMEKVHRVDCQRACRGVLADRRRPTHHGFGTRAMPPVRRPGRVFLRQGRACPPFSGVDNGCLGVMSLPCTGNRVMSRNRDSVRTKAESGSETGENGDFCHMPASERIQCWFHSYRTCPSSNRAFPRGAGQRPIHRCPDWESRNREQEERANEQDEPR